MTAQPTGPAPGSYEVIHLGGVRRSGGAGGRFRAAAGTEAARLRAGTGGRRGHCGAAGVEGAGGSGPDLLRARRPGMAAAGPDQVSFRVIYEERAIDQARGSSLMIPPVSARCWTPSAGWPVIPFRPSRSRTGRRACGGYGSAGTGCMRSTVTWCRSGISTGGRPVADLPLAPAPGISAAHRYPARISPRLPGPLLRPR